MVADLAAGSERCETALSWRCDWSECPEFERGWPVGVVGLLFVAYGLDIVSGASYGRYEWFRSSLRDCGIVGGTNFLSESAISIVDERVGGIGRARGLIGLPGTAECGGRSWCGHDDGAHC